MSTVEQRKDAKQLTSDLALLKAARGKIAAGWCEGTRGLRVADPNVGGYMFCHGNDPRATMVCAIGALEFATGERYEIVGGQIDALTLKMGFADVCEMAKFSNTQGQAAIVARFDAAIQSLEVGKLVPVAA